MDYQRKFDIAILLKNNAKKHKSKPTQFSSVAGGVKKRLEATQKRRRSSRLSIFDSVRNLSRCPSPAPPSEAQLKMEHRRQQLEKWKEEKEKKKKEAAAQKKKPFITGVARAPLKHVLPPPPKPSTSGRVTRSQTTRNTLNMKAQSKSFAPINASFQPQLNTRIPFVNLVPLKTNKNMKEFNVTFEPVMPKSVREQKQTMNEVKQTRSRTQNKNKAASKVNRNKVDHNMNGKISKPTLKINSRPIESSSSSETVISPIRNHKQLPSQPSPFQSSTETDSSTPPIPVLTKSTRTRKSTPATNSTKLSKINSQDSSNSPIHISKSLRKSEPKQFTPKNPVPKSESSSEERLRSPKDVPLTPEQIVEEAVKHSPCVTLSRGKDNARKEMKKKLDEGLLDEDASDIENVDHFRRQLATEIKRITEMCEAWDKILEQTALPDSIQECVLGAVGQARLLVSQKLAQFATLVERCARPEPARALVTPADLHGFWDMVFMQVENVDMRFKKLEELRARGWSEEAPALVARRKPANRAKPKPAHGQSRIKDMIAAARKAAKAQVATAPVEKTFEAGFFTVRSPVRSPASAPRTPLGRPTLLKAVLSSEANKASASKNSASFAMLRASVLGKNVECEGVAPLPQTPLTVHDANATPGRSILKQSAAKTTNRSTKKSIKVVLFDKSDTDIDSSFTDQPIPIEKDNREVNIEISSEHKEEKENSRRKSRRLTRQDAQEQSPMKTRQTRSRQKTEALETAREIQKTPQEGVRTPHEGVKTSQEGVKTRRSARKSKVLEEVENVIEHRTPRRASRRKDVALSLLA